MVLGLAALVLAAIGCSATKEGASGTEGSGASGGGTGASGGSGGAGGTVLVGPGGSGGAAGGCGSPCSPDLHQVIDCQGNVVETCTGTDACDPMTGTCRNACEVAVDNEQSVGCEYYPTFMHNIWSSVCFAVFVANTWNEPAHITVQHGQNTLPIENFTRIPQGVGPGLTYGPFEAAQGIPPGEVAILFLSGPSGSPQIPNITCPVPSAIPSGVMLQQTGIGTAFHVQSDVPVVAYQFNPYAGGYSEVTGASLLIPTSAWDTNYIAADAYALSPGSVPPSMNIVAMEDDTLVTLVPVAPVVAGGGVPAGAANTPMTFTLNRGQHAQISQNDELTGSVVDADKPIGLMAGHVCHYVPVNNYACDHGEQMVPPVRALGSEYVGVMHQPRQGEPALWRVIGAVDGTQLTWSTDVGGPATLQRGEVVEFLHPGPFVVSSQDEDHPFLAFTYMVGSQYSPGLAGYGDSDTVLVVPTRQYNSRYVFFADPTYPETSLVLVRSKLGGVFHDVTLDCLGTVGGWQPVGEYEWTRVALITGDFQPVGNCTTGRHEIESDAPFGLWVWGWGTPETSTQTAWVSYGYPGGMNVQQINQVVVPPVPR
jgi:hypothetical protein